MPPGVTEGDYLNIRCAVGVRKRHSDGKRHH